MLFEEIDTLACEVCGEEYLPHMLNTNSFLSLITCDACDAEIARDQMMFSESNFVADDRFYG